MPPVLSLLAWQLPYRQATYGQAATQHSHIFAGSTSYNLTVSLSKQSWAATMLTGHVPENGLEKCPF